MKNKIYKAKIGFGLVPKYKSNNPFVVKNPKVRMRGDGKNRRVVGGTEPILEHFKHENLESMRHELAEKHSGVTLKFIMPKAGRRFKDTSKSTEIKVIHPIGAKVPKVLARSKSFGDGKMDVTYFIRNKKPRHKLKYPETPRERFFGPEGTKYKESWTEEDRWGDGALEHDWSRNKVIAFRQSSEKVPTILKVKNKSGQEEERVVMQPSIEDTIMSRKFLRFDPEESKIKEKWKNIGDGRMNPQLKMGIKAEAEHKKTIHYIKTYFDKHKRLPSDKEVYTKIAKDHLKEDPKYYSKLAKIEKNK